MTNNDILRRLRYIFDYSDSAMIALFKAVEYKATREQISNWLKADDAPDFQNCSDTQLALFLNGMIIEKRGKKEGAAPAPEKQITNNIVFRKLKIALNLKDEDILEILNLVQFSLGKHELSAFFRKASHKNHRKCKDQVLRNFLKGLQHKYRPSSTTKSDFSWE